MRGLSLRLSLRVFRRHAKLTIIAVGSLALGLAAACIGVSASRAILMRPPGVARPDELVTVFASRPDAPYHELSYPDYRELADRNQVFSGMAALPFAISFTRIQFGRNQTNGLVNAVSDSYFRVLGVPLLFGPGFAPGDDDQVTKKAVLSYAYWQSIGADPHVTGQTVTVYDVALTVVGVAPPGFVGTILTDLPAVWLPLSAHPASPDWRTDRQASGYGLLGRLKPGVSAATAGANVRGIIQTMAVAHPEFHKDDVGGVTSTSMLPAGDVAEAELFCTVILGVVALLLLAACTNVLNLLLALSSFRRQEFLVRAALGAGRARLFGQLLVDATLLSGSGGLVGFALAEVALRRLLSFKPYVPGLGVIPITVDFQPTLVVAAIMMAVVAVTAFALGCGPGLDASRVDVAGALRGETAIGGAKRGWFRTLLVASQLTACTVVLVGVGLCFQSLHNLRQIDLGYTSQGVGVISIEDLPTRSKADRAALYARLLQTASATGGLEASSLSAVLPLDSLEEVPVVAGGSAKAESVHRGFADGAYFATLRIPVLEGRVFGPRDGPAAPEVAVVNRTMATRAWPGLDPVGQTVTITTTQQRVTVVGVVGDSKVEDVDEAPAAVLYLAVTQHPPASAYLFVRARGDVRAMLAPLATTLGKLDGKLSADPLTTLDEWTAFGFYLPRLTLTCVTGFGVLALLLGAVGLYGAVFYSVSGRTRELGVRVALGAQPRDLALMILRQAARVSGLGVALGLALSIGGTAVVRSWLYGIRMVEWPVLAGVALAMIGLTLLLAYAAARPGLRVDPLRAIRHI